MKKSKFYISLIFILFITLSIISFVMYNSFVQNVETNQIKDPRIVRFMPIGDSYTIGNGVKTQERWPNLLVDSLKKEYITVQLVKNPAVSGYDAQDALEYELPIFEKEHPDFGTLFIGTNDSFRGRNLEQFQNDYVELISRMQTALTIKSNLVIITIPDYAEFPGIKGSGITSEKIEQYNQIIREEAGKRNLAVVDLFLVKTLSLENYFISDGIHPNAEGIKIWHDMIFLTVKKVLKNE